MGWGQGQLHFKFALVLHHDALILMYLTVNMLLDFVCRHVCLHVALHVFNSDL